MPFDGHQHHFPVNHDVEDMPDIYHADYGVDRMPPTKRVAAAQPLDSAVQVGIVGSVAINSVGSHSDSTFYPRLHNRLDPSPEKGHFAPAKLLSPLAIALS